MALVRLGAGCLPGGVYDGDPLRSLANESTDPVYASAGGFKV